MSKARYRPRSLPVVRNGMDTDEISADLHSAIEAVVREELGRFGVGEVEVIEAEDHEGTPSILVLVHYAEANAEPEPKALSDTVFRLNIVLFERKERRFAYVLHKIPETAPKSRRRVAAH